MHLFLNLIDKTRVSVDLIYLSFEFNTRYTFEQKFNQWIFVSFGMNEK